MSSSMNTICCHVPNTSFPSCNGIVRSGPSSEALTCECPFPSCQWFSCSYGILLGAILSSMAGKSCNSPGSYSMVVSAAVDPGKNRTMIPLRIYYSRPGPVLHR